MKIDAAYSQVCYPPEVNARQRAINNHPRTRENHVRCFRSFIANETETPMATAQSEGVICTFKPEGPAESVDAVKVEVEMMESDFKSSEDEPAPTPNHPPIDQIPPVPMSDESHAERRTSTGPGTGIMYDTETGETSEYPAEFPEEVIDFLKGDGYLGVDGGEGLGDVEMPAGMFGSMSVRTNTQ